MEQLQRLELTEMPTPAFELQLQHPRHQVYILSWVMAGDVGLASFGYAAVLLGVSSTNRIAFSVWPKSRLSPQGRRQFPILFINELLLLHRQSHLIMLIPDGLMSTQVMTRLSARYHRLHPFHPCFC